MQKIILASQSPRRKQLLEWAEIEFDILVSDAEENYPDHLNFSEVAIHIAKNKALKVKDEFNPTLPILAADTIVVCENEIIGKPKDKADAMRIIRKLSGKTHEVITGVFMMSDQKEIAFADITEVCFYELTDAQIEFYIDKYKPYDKAGAYAIQEWIGVTGIESIKGDFYNVMGLPVSRVVQALNSNFIN
jgi:septum formation protein